MIEIIRMVDVYTTKVGKRVFCICLLKSNVINCYYSVLHEVS